MGFKNPLIVSSITELPILIESTCPPVVCSIVSLIFPMPEGLQHVSPMPCQMTTGVAACENHYFKSGHIINCDKVIGVTLAGKGHKAHNEKQGNHIRPHLTTECDICEHSKLFVAPYLLFHKIKLYFLHHKRSDTIKSLKRNNTIYLMLKR